jgi:MoaA/NifB/PqqE/SkfB family radical SAM enzyme
MVKRLLTFATDKIYNLPVLVLMPHSRCNCRCVMCDIWKSNHEKKELSIEVLEKHSMHFKKLGVREVVFSGGEALMHSNLWRFCEVLKKENVQITLLSTGLLLQKNARAIIDHCREVIISLDGSEPVHDKIRNIPGGFRKLAEGVKALKQINPAFRVSGRCVLQRYNYFDFPNIVHAANEIGLDQISFLGADISTTAFNRTAQWDEERVSEIALTRSEAKELQTILERSFTEFASAYASRFIAESPAKLEKIVRYYQAVNGSGDFPETICNAPWVSAVIESDGSVLPCFFHKPYGNIFDADLLEILNSPAAISFRKNLDVNRDATCKKCVCSLKLGLTQMN